MIQIVGEKNIWVLQLYVVGVRLSYNIMGLVKAVYVI